jgi:hypothetical protein
MPTANGSRSKQKVKPHCLTRRSIIQNFTLFQEPIKFDLDDVQPAEDKDASRLAAEAQLLNQARIGFAKANVLGLELKFGKYNVRPVNPVELRKILASIRIGPERYKLEYLIPIAVKKSAVDMSTITTTPGDGGDVYKVLKFIGDDKQQVWGCGGRHRTGALEKWHKELMHEVEKMRRQYNKLLKDPGGMNPDDIGLLRQELEEKTRELKGLPFWGVAVYDFGEFQQF